MIVHQVTNSWGNYNYNAFIYKETYWESHFHKNYELIYAYKGETEVILNGVSHILLQGELILISPFSIHSLKGKPNSKVWVSVFSDDYISAFAEKNKHKSYIKFRCDGNIEKILKENLFQSNQPEKYLLISFLYMVCSQCDKNTEYDITTQNNKFIYQVIEYISENIDTNITLKELAQELNYEYHYFSALFNENFYMNFKSFINIFRIETAIKLLSDEAYTITEICEKCGFGSIRNFNRVFKQLSGDTPNNYRKKANNKN